MALSEKHRHAMYEYLTRTGLEEEATNEVMSYFPARDVEEPVTKELLKGELALVRMEFHEEISGLRAEMRDEFRHLLQWMIGTQVAFLAIVVALIVAMH
ncbi:MAG: hypothetical protein JST73_03605 [Actinobacteria bacterium]|nr:hypothetical protein [Actinomycetota bacterium]